MVTSGYMRNNVTEEVWAEIFGISQSCVPRYIKLLTPVIADAMKDHRPTAQDAAEATRGAIALVDGTLWPCWSWFGAKDLWAGKYKPTGHEAYAKTRWLKRRGRAHKAGRVLLGRWDLGLGV
jgi:Helix-turn-helix of DDE superfamily endonuclease